MQFKDKKEEFIYWMRKSDLAKQHKDKETFLICINKAREIKKEIESNQLYEG